MCIASFGLRIGARGRPARLLKPTLPMAARLLEYDHDGSYVFTLGSGQPARRTWYFLPCSIDGISSIKLIPQIYTGPHNYIHVSKDYRLKIMRF